MYNVCAPTDSFVVAPNDSPATAGWAAYMAALLLPMKRSIIYVDGFNLYYGALKGTAWKWLDLERYFGLLRQDDDIVEIKYFTAEVTGPKRRKQLVYLNALEQSSKVTIIKGVFKNRRLTCQVRNCHFRGSKVFRVPEEKGTDVNIAVQLLGDVLQDSIERAIVVSGDSDLVPAVALARKCRPNVRITVYVPANDPTRGAATELRAAAHSHKTLPTALLARAQLPDPVLAKDGSPISRPADW